MLKAWSLLGRCTFPMNPSYVEGSRLQGWIWQLMIWCRVLCVPAQGIKRNTEGLQSANENNQPVV